MSRYITTEMFALPSLADDKHADAGVMPDGRRIIGFHIKHDGTLFKDILWAYVGKGVNIYDPVVILKPEMIRLADNVRIDAFCKLEGGQGVYVGRYVHISSFCHINGGGGTVVLGDYVGLASGAKVLGGTNLMDAPTMTAAAPPELQRVERLHTVIDDYAFLGTNAVVMPGVMVGKGAVIGAGAVVTKGVPSWEVWAGVPAKKIGVRPRQASAFEAGQIYGVEV